MTIYLDGDHLTIEDVHKIARLDNPVQIKDESRIKIKSCRELLLKLVEKNIAIYGVTTGIGELASVRVSPEQSKELQKRIVFSHSAGTGVPECIDVVKAALVLRVNTLSKGYSGVTELLVDTLIEMINKNVIPLVYEKGSVGTSGDLSPLSQIGEVVMGYGQAYYKGELLPGAEALKRAGIKPVELTYKEGLGVINGSQMMTGKLALLVNDAQNILKNALIASSMSIEALRAVESAFDDMVHQVRPFDGQISVAANIRKLIKDSEIIKNKTGKVQDGYSIRCTPQIIGPSLDAVCYVRKQVEKEMNSAADNPLFFTKEGVYKAAGNFHGQNIAMAADFFGIAMSEIADLSERHINRMLNPVLSNGLPDFLVEGKGLNSGLMVAQYTAAALVSENKVLSHPASVDSISVSADQEDHVSMGPIGVRKAKEILDNVAAVLAIEMMSASQAFDFRKQKPGAGTGAAYNVIREKVEFLSDDKPLHPDIKSIKELITSGKIVDAVEKSIGKIELWG